MTCACGCGSELPVPKYRAWRRRFIEGHRHRQRPKIRTLKHGELVPDGEPKRYRHASGYVRLRWRLPTSEIVEALEHRINAGRVSDAPCIHHVNHDRSDNNPANLRPLTASEHARLHAADSRRFDRSIAIRLYESGLSFQRVATALNVHNSTVFKGLKAAGIAIRPKRKAIDLRKLRMLRADGFTLEEIGAALGVSQTTVHSRLKELEMAT